MGKQEWVKHNMHSLLILGTDEKELENEIQKVCSTYHISPFDKTIVQKEKSIGIEDIRNLQKDLLLTPLESPYKAGIVYDADTMTVDAQNAFLKTLEEPPPNTLILLLAENRQRFLPTVLSRCNIIQTHISPKKQQSISDDAFAFLFTNTVSTGEKLKYAEKIAKSKDDAITWVEQGIVFLRKNLLSHPNSAVSLTIRKFQDTHSLLKNTNANTRIVVEHLFLSL